MTPFLLHLLRHGAPETPGLLMGRTDGAPSAAGIAACRDKAAALQVETILCSGLARTHMAAEAISVHHGQDVQIDPRWRELDFGDWDGLSPDIVDADALNRFHADPDASPPPNGERWSALVARVAEALAEMDGGDRLVVTHGGAMRAALAHLCGFAQPQLWAIDLPYAALLTLRVWPGQPPMAQIVGLQP